MPPKTSNIHHVTFHFYKSAVVLSVPSNTSFNSLKAKLIPALKPLANSVTIPLPTSASGVQIWETRELVEGDESQEQGSIRNMEEDGVGSKTIAQLGWGRWKTVFVSFKASDGTFSEPIYTIPDVEDEDPEEPNGGAL